MPNPIPTNINIENRKDRRNPLYRVTWSCKGVQYKKAFASLLAAKAFAREVDDLTGERLKELPNKKEFAAAIILRDILCPGMSLPEIVTQFSQSKFHYKHFSTGEAIEQFRKEKWADVGSSLHLTTLFSHLDAFKSKFENRILDSITYSQLRSYLRQYVNDKTRLGHITSIRSFFTWARDKGGYLPTGIPTQADLVPRPWIKKTEHAIYTPEEFRKILRHAPLDLIGFVVLGQLAGIRAAERCRLIWADWRKDEDGKIVLGSEITKTGKRRRVDVCPALALWLEFLQKADLGPKMVPHTSPYKALAKLCLSIGMRTKRNALRAGYASYHLELYDNAALTAKNDGHSIEELESDYKSISGVTKEAAKQIFETTPEMIFAPRP